MKLILSLLVTCAVITGCASSETRLPYNDVMTMRADCRNKELQIAYLERQLELTDSSIGSATGAWGSAGAGLRGTYASEKESYEREYRSRIKTMIWQMRSLCPAG